MARVINRGWKEPYENAPWTIHLTPKLDGDDSKSTDQADDSDAEPEHETVRMIAVSEPLSSLETSAHVARLAPLLNAGKFEEAQAYLVKHGLAEEDEEPFIMISPRRPSSGS